MRSRHTAPAPPRGISERNRTLLSLLHRRIRGPFSAPEAAAVVGIEHGEATDLLVYLATRGWLARLRRGLYATVPLDAVEPSAWREDPWAVAAKIFRPGYIGGWSACEHWGFTEQTFRDVVVVTARRLRHRHPEIQGTRFRVKVVQPGKIFGTRLVWRREVRVPVSDPSRTIVDLLEEPALGGGIRHVAEVAAAYFSGRHREDRLLAQYAERLGNGAIYKRLGYLLEVSGVKAPDLSRLCRERRSTGLVRLDPSIDEPGRILRRWNLRVNARLGPALASP